jgi:hypothetical protein
VALFCVKNFHTWYLSGGVILCKKNSTLGTYLVALFCVKNFHTWYLSGGAILSKNLPHLVPVWWRYFV